MKKSKWVMTCEDAMVRGKEVKLCGKETHERCCLCESAGCDEHMHFVRENDGMRDDVCDECYQICMEAYEHKQVAGQKG